MDNMNDQNNNPTNNPDNQWGQQGNNPYGQSDQHGQPGQQGAQQSGPFQPAQQPAAPNYGAPQGQPGQPVADPYGAPAQTGHTPLQAPPEMPRSSSKVFAAIIGGVMLLAAAVGIGWWIGSDDDGNTTATGDDVETAMGDPIEREGVEGMEIPRPGELSSTLQDVPQSVVRIVAGGEVAQPDGNVFPALGSGSGVIISEDGVVVTNQHVVGGAAFLEVYVDGEAQARSARVLGVSLCSDLAVIDIEGAGFTPLPFTMDPATLGTTVYSAGYPLGDPEFTLTKGIVSKENANGRTVFSSVRSVLEHDARINGGNSGGPLVNESGQIVGINYQSLNVAAPQFKAISSPQAWDVIEAMAAGNDVDTIGVNGQIVELESGFGFFVSAIETGTPAERAGIEAGDIILEIERFPVSIDGTMGTFCDTLRTQGSDALLEVAVVRPTTGEVFRGELNDTEPLALAFSTPAVMEETGIEGEMTPAATEGSFTRITDDSGTVTVEVPTGWADVDTRSLSAANGEITVPAISASPNLEAFRTSFDAPGVEVLGVPGDEISFDGLWDGFNNLAANCTDPGEVTEGAIGNSTGAQQVARGCGPNGAALVMIQVQDPNSNYFLRITVQVLTNEDISAAERVIATANLTVQ